MVMSESLVTIGVATGIAIALGVSRFVATLLFQLPAGDPLTLAGAVAIMAIVSDVCRLPSGPAGLEGGPDGGAAL
jgi:hypothetical protein